jgi:hypothetical protein
MRRRFTDKRDRSIGGFGQLTVTDDGEIIPAESWANIYGADESGIAIVVVRTMSKPRKDL